MKWMMVLLLAFSFAAEAKKTRRMKVSQNTRNSNVLSKTIRSEAFVTDATQKNNVSLMGLALFGSGLGLSYDRALTSTFTLGGFASVAQLSSDSEELKSSFVSDAKLDFQTFGVRSRYFISGTADAKGLYGSLALVSVKMNTKIDFAEDADLSSAKNKTGYQVGAGYQLVGNTFENSKLVFNLGLEYGTGFGGSYKAQKIGSVNSMQTEVIEALGIEFNMGMVF